jgi:hypothetical protein
VKLITADLSFGLLQENVTKWEVKSIMGSWYEDLKLDTFLDLQAD